MSTYRHKFVLILDGTKHEITTSARDQAAIDMNMPPGEAVLQIIYAACIRTGIDVPSEWEAFADLIDEVEDLEPEIPFGGEANPTRATASDIPPSLSQSVPE